ncbi:MmcQ/YjbR family DNA-binding protein [Jatrophihabitans endophyticus]|uniref:MmcQ/YjbR family DNA-binding protein n=1 Tax=Jatrophihabitans endophyticus TaxID=1206085 RepID=UPI0019EB0D34|nr:MmcQ/YjbR family DNA-binding protein [Jatrophihabitans endophyticus]MBE7187323.1 MmcQ/YjbR family DNA-binding protein [Jatrophihabitans endophyticus]
MADFDDVRRIALSLPETAEDNFTFNVVGKSFVWPWRERVAPKKKRVRRLDVVALRTDGVEEKDELIASDPAKFFTEDHYNGYAAVLLRLDQVDADELRELLTDAWRVQAPKKLRKAHNAAVAQPDPPA